MKNHTNKMVTKVFYINEEWVMQYRHRPLDIVHSSDPNPSMTTRTDATVQGLKNKQQQTNESRNNETRDEVKLELESSQASRISHDTNSPISHNHHRRRRRISQLFDPDNMSESIVLNVASDDDVHQPSSDPTIFHSHPIQLSTNTTTDPVVPRQEIEKEEPKDRKEMLLHHHHELNESIEAVIIQSNDDATFGTSNNTDATKYSTLRIQTNLDTEHGTIVKENPNHNKNTVHPRKLHDTKCRFSVTPTTYTDDAISANSIISSWFFQLNQATIGYCMMNLRNRLYQYGCNVNNLDAGNYVHAMIFTKDQYTTPVLIQQYVNALHGTSSSNDPLRINTNDGKDNADNDDTIPRFDSNDPKFLTSMSVNWANFYRDVVEIHPQTSHRIHFPLYSGNVLSNQLSHRVSAINLFTAQVVEDNNASTKNNDDEDSTNENPSLSSFNKNNRRRRRRAGAFVLCTEQVWRDHIEQCGIVDEMIAET
jgi:hypothetical protein